MIPYSTLGAGKRMASQNTPWIVNANLFVIIMICKIFVNK